MNNQIAVNIGEQRFDKLIEEHKFYIDKTGFVKEWWEYGSTVTLITRPRRFGKTLNMSMLECFFSNKYADRGDLFEGLSIWEEKTAAKEYQYRYLQGTFSVIFLSFAGIEAAEYKDMEYKITEIIAKLYEQNNYLLEGNLLSEKEKNYFRKVQPGMDSSVASGAVNSITGFMQRYFGKNVIILLDEYDSPMQAAWLSGYWDKAVSFFNGLFNSTFKTNPYLYRGVITGITRVAKKSIFSGLNNPEVITTTSNEYARYFGFTEDEVFGALDAAGLGSEKAQVKQWYDGFTFGRYMDIYNPWSIASFIKKNGKYDSYWANTSSNGLVNSLIQKGNAEVKIMMEELLQEKNITAEIDEQIALYSFSSFDLAKNASDDDAPERFYHGFVLGLMVELAPRFEITSNRESGFGRYDVMLVPFDKEKDCAYIIEFKVHKARKEKDLAKTVDNALSQIAEKQYETQLIAKGFAAEKIRKYGFAFRGKECLIGGGESCWKILNKI